MTFSEALSEYLVWREAWQHAAKRGNQPNVIEAAGAMAHWATQMDRMLAEGKDYVYEGPE